MGNEIKKKKRGISHWSVLPFKAGNAESIIQHHGASPAKTELESSDNYSPTTDEPRTIFWLRMNKRLRKFVKCLLARRMKENFLQKLFVTSYFLSSAFNLNSSKRNLCCLWRFAVYAVPIPYVYQTLGESLLLQYLNVQLSILLSSCIY